MLLRSAHVVAFLALVKHWGKFMSSSCLLRQGAERSWVSLWRPQSSRPFVLSLLPPVLPMAVCEPQRKEEESEGGRFWRKMVVYKADTFSADTVEGCWAFPLLGLSRASFDVVAPAISRVAASYPASLCRSLCWSIYPTHLPRPSWEEYFPAPIWLNFSSPYAPSYSLRLKPCCRRELVIT